MKLPLLAEINEKFGECGIEDYYAISTVCDNCGMYLTVHLPFETRRENKTVQCPKCKCTSGLAIYR